MAHRMTAIMKNARPQMISSTRTRTITASSGSHVKRSIPSSAQTALITMVMAVLSTMAISASARTKAWAVCQARFAVTDATPFRSARKSSHSPLYSRMALAGPSFAKSVANSSLQAATLRRTIQSDCCADMVSEAYQPRRSCSKAREGKRRPLVLSQPRNWPIQQSALTTRRAAGWPPQSARTARWAQGLPGSKAVSKLQVSVGGPTSGVQRGARRPTSTVTSVRRCCARVKEAGGARALPASARGCGRLMAPRCRQPGRLQRGTPRKHMALSSQLALASGARSAGAARKRSPGTAKKGAISTRPLSHSSSARAWTGTSRGSAASPPRSSRPSAACSCR
mmetsp:Transcript_16378/g.49464  ORF Transcript_16378/g.49464 Transcript_16378/m.49464 type:complete len:339 (+) Transcript_16378:173-1189(+)